MKEAEVQPGGHHHCVETASSANRETGEAWEKQNEPSIPVLNVDLLDVRCAARAGRRAVIARR